MQFSIRRWLAIGMLALPAAQLPFPSVHAATSFTVSSVADEVDSAPGDGVCVSASGACTLRAAIQETNALAGADTIALPAGTYTIAIPGSNEDHATTGDLDVTEDLTVIGDGEALTIIDAIFLDRIFDVPASITLNVQGITLQNGRSTTTVYQHGGGAIRNSGTVSLANVVVQHNEAVGQYYPSGGAILNTGILTADSVVFLNNRATAGYGGAIRNTGTATLTSALFVENRAYYAGAIRSETTLAVGASGFTKNTADVGAGAIGALGTTSIAGSTFAGNTSGSNGGALQVGNTVTISRSSFVGNTAFAGGGGGIHGSGNLTVSESLIDANAAPQGTGGGIFFSGTQLHLSSSTVSRNSAVSAGGIYVNHALTTSRSSIVNSTISGNEANRFGGLSGARGQAALINTTVTQNIARVGNAGGVEDNDFYNDVFVVRHSILAGNVSGDGLGADCRGKLISQGYTLVQQAQNCTINTAVGDQRGVDAQLGPLESLGGALPAHAPLVGSPVIDVGDLAGCTDNANAPLLIDQRGTTRPQDGNDDGVAICDPGAIEYTLPIKDVIIDIKPGSDENPINLGSNGKTTVAVIDTDEVPIATIDATTVEFAGAFVARHKDGRLMVSYEDVNGDGRADLIMHFETAALQLTADATEATLGGLTIDGTHIRGKDAVLIVP